MTRTKHIVNTGTCFKLLWTLLFLVHHTLNAQIFVEEGEDRGMDGVAFSVGLGGGGVSAIDFDQDGDDDITLGNNGEILFFRNVNGNFAPIDFGIETPSGDIRGVAWTDINNDGHLDFLIASDFGEIKLYKNIGSMEFVDITDSSGISTDITGNWGVSFADINRDGYLDLQLCRYVDWFTIPDNPSIMPERWTRLYLNNGDETFTDITIESGLIIEPAPVFQGVFFDFNNDLWPDNHSIIDRLPGNELFVNNEGVFTNITDDYGVSFPDNDFMSNSVADYDNDGYLDIFMTNNGGLFTPTYLLKNNQGESFTNVAESVGVEVYEFSWGAVWIDADNDGWQDLFFSTRYSGPNYFFMNDGGTFTNAQDEMELDYDLPSYSAAKGDFDNDGFYDLLIQSKSPHESTVLMNQGGENHYIKMTLHGTVSNSLAIGSWIKVYADNQEYVHYTLLGEAYIAQHSQHVIFGLGESTVVDSVKIQYPSGHTDTYFNLVVDSTYQFYEGDTYQLSVFPADTAICEGVQIQLDAGEHAGYLWDTGDTTRYITVDATGTYSVTVFNEFGISASNQSEVEVLANPLISENISPIPCFGDSLGEIVLENLYEFGPDAVIWDNGMTGDVIDSLPSGVYSYQYFDTNGCMSSGSVTLFDPLELVVFANSNPEDVEAANGTILVTVFGGVSPYTILLEGDTVETLITDLEAGEYSVTVIDDNGCTETIDVVVQSTLGVNENPREDISIFPNPTKDQIEVRSSASMKRVLIHDVAGVQVKDLQPRGNFIDLMELAPGLYYLWIEFENGRSEYFRVVKE